MKQPDVSVLMAVRNGLTAYPDGMLSRVIDQTLQEENVELCIVDDCSTDDTRVWLLSSLDKTRGRFYHLHERRGPAAAYQDATHLATGRYIILQSVRSWYEPGALKAMAEALDSHPEVGFVYGQTRYHGASEHIHVPPPFIKQRFFHNFDSLFGYMYRCEALDAGCEYVSYLEKDGNPIDIADYDFAMQLIVKMGWSGLALRDRLCLHYYYSGQGQQTALVHRHQHEIDAIFRERWGTA